MKIVRVKLSHYVDMVVNDDEAWEELEPSYYLNGMFVRNESATENERDFIYVDVPKYLNEAFKGEIENALGEGKVHINDNEMEIDSEIVYSLDVDKEWLNNKPIEQDSNWAIYMRNAVENSGFLNDEKKAA